MEDKFLPIGTVVLLKGGKKRVMIIGFCAMAKEKAGKVALNVIYNALIVIP